MGRRILTLIYEGYLSETPFLDANIVLAAVLYLYTSSIVKLVQNIAFCGPFVFVLLTSYSNFVIKKIIHFIFFWLGVLGWYDMNHG